MTVRSEEAKAELKEAEQKLKEAEQKLADAKAELADAKKLAELADAEAKQEQIEQKLMETKQAAPANTAGIQRLEQKLQGLDDAVKELRLSVISKSTIVRRLESQLLPAIAGPAFTSSGGERKMQSRQIAQRHQHCILITCEHLCVSFCLSLSLSLFPCPSSCFCASSSFSASQQDIERMLEANRKAVEETIQRQFAFQQRESVALSELSAGHFERIRQYVRMTVEPVEWSAILPTSSTASTSSTSSTPAFQWSDENENQQYERYLSYLRSKLLSVPRHLSVERAPPSLLDTFKSRYLPFDVRGTSDVMVVERASGITPVFGIRMLMELKKQRPDAKDVYQTMGELLAADQHTPFSPIVVLTDLAEYWRFCWLEGRQHPILRSARQVS